MPSKNNKSNKKNKNKHKKTNTNTNTALPEKTSLPEFQDYLPFVSICTPTFNRRPYTQ